MAQEMVRDRGHGTEDGLLIVLILPVSSSGIMYVQTGSDISDCNMKCPNSNGVLELYRQCGGRTEPLLDLHCNTLYTKPSKPRYSLDTQSGCWKVTRAGKTDSCVYNTEFNSNPTRQLSSTDIRILDPVLISNMTSNGSRLGQDIAVSVQYSGEESAVTWEVDGEPLPERYRLIDDNRTLIVPSVQRDDAERTFRVRITNPVSEETRDHRLINDTMFIRMLETEAVTSDSSRRHRGAFGGAGAVAVILIFLIMYWALRCPASQPIGALQSSYQLTFNLLDCLLCLLITSVSSGPVYVRSGADITGCDMTCPQDDVTLELSDLLFSFKPILLLFCILIITKIVVGICCRYESSVHISDVSPLPGLLCLLITSVSSGPVYVRSGADITGCDMTCPQDDVTLELYRHCGGKEKTLLERHCYYNHTISHDPRLHLDTRSGCWKLTPARKDDSCVYKIWCHCDSQYLMSSTDIRVLDPILISNITGNGSRLGQDIAVSVQYSGEESAVTWEVDREPLPERYRLIDDNRTLIVPSVQRDDAERTFRVRITNPVSEETREHRLEIRGKRGNYWGNNLICIEEGS
ncbi:PREDICTED: uncharacterized protein LOC108801725 [Nanorana parkeri]|uniref:uncharacterized protein LOC108801725 n=1 Tax=Nanorana parkeri TaxID=125878 RepID=UPI000855097B|nr:PREDICTED: uncharacterized protein LOC108801725 [Nanorana parkeri]